MRLANRIAAGSLLALLIGVPSVSADEIKPRIPCSRWQAVTVPLAHLRLVNGRRFFRGPRYLSNRYPYYLAATGEEKAAKFGRELRLKNAHRLFAPITTVEQARELARLLTGGVPVPGAAAYDAMRAAALALKPTATGWGIKLKDGKPGCFGVAVRKQDDAFVVRTLIFTCSGYASLHVVEETFRIRPGRVVTREVRTWIEGPPQSWQTAGAVDPDAEKRLFAEVRRFRAAMLKILGRKRTLATVKAALAGKPTFAAIRARLGEPDRDIGSGIHIHLYGLNDGTAVIFGVGGEDQRPTYVRHVSLVTTADGRSSPGRKIEELGKSDDDE